METPICRACGCSLVRLGITQEKSVSLDYHEKQYWFCCEGCRQLFISSPEKLLSETSSLVVCPVCLAEKNINSTVEYYFNGMIFNFCRCPHCLDVFNKNQDYFIKRLAWQTNYPGIFAELSGCCTKN